eukprot:352149-Chlamydomonas_euryale.AAC.12
MLVRVQLLLTFMCRWRRPVSRLRSGVLPLLSEAVRAVRARPPEQAADTQDGTGGSTSHRVTE